MMHCDSLTSHMRLIISYLAMATFSLSDYGRITADEPRERQLQRMQNPQERKENEPTFLTRFSQSIFTYYRCYTDTKQQTNKLRN
jgi:hypothetical protein